MGALEGEVLAELWRRREPATPADIQAVLGADLAYTTVMTILSRLWQKGLVERHRVGRAYAYAPKLTEADYTAQHMQAALAKSQDRRAALSSFARGLSKRELQLLRQVLDDAP
jgi:predicted transcriptional regulator